jgi:hypothetical protein
MEFLIAWLVFAFVVAIAAGARSRSGIGWFLLSAVLSPLVGLILTHCAQLSGVHPAKQSGTIRNFRKVVALAHRWWLTDGAAERCGELLASRKEPPLMLYLIWSNYTRLSKQIAAAAIFGSSINRSAKLVALPADLIPRFEAAQEPFDLLNT